MRSSVPNRIPCVLWLLATALSTAVSCGPKIPPHSVTLTWEAPPTAATTPVGGFDVYRSATSSTGFARIASRVPTYGYVDTGVVSGRTYYYVVATLDRAG